MPGLVVDSNMKGTVSSDGRALAPKARRPA